MPGKVAYIMSRFPHLPETFILREMIARPGGKVGRFLCTRLILQKQAVVHTEARPFLARAQRLPFFSYGIARSLLRQFVRRPVKLVLLFSKILWHNRSNLKFLLRAVALFPKAIYAAELMQAEGIEHIHAHYATHPALVAWIIHQITGIPYSITVHAHDIFVERAMIPVKIQEAAFVGGDFRLQPRISQPRGRKLDPFVDFRDPLRDPAAILPASKPDPARKRADRAGLDRQSPTLQRPDPSDRGLRQAKGPGHPLPLPHHRRGRRICPAQRPDRGQCPDRAGRAYRASFSG